MDVMPKLAPRAWRRSRPGMSPVSRLPRRCHRWPALAGYNGRLTARPCPGMPRP